MPDPAVIEIEMMRHLRCRRGQDGPVFREPGGLLVVLDANAAQRLEAENYADLTMADDVGDRLRGQRSERVDWTQLRGAWSARLRRLGDAAGLRALAGRMARLLAAEAGRAQDLVWLAERVTVEPLVPVIVDGLSPRAQRRVVAETLSKVAWVLSDVDAHRAGRWHPLKMTALQVLAGIAVRRELKGRASGRRPRREDLADTVVDVLPALGLGRAVDAVTALLTAITGTPGAAAASLLFELARQDAWRARLEAELSALSMDALCEAPMRRAPLTARFVKEVLRTWSSPAMLRPVRTGLRVGQGDDAVDLAVGDTYMLSPFLVHQDPAGWADADRFDPDRWLAGEDRAHCPHGSFVPFGWAPKSCIGAHLGMAQLMLLAHLVCTTYRLDVPDLARARMAVASMVRPMEFHGAIARRATAAVPA